MRKSKMLEIALFSVITFIIAGCDQLGILSELNEEDDSKSTSNTVTITYVTELGNVPSPFTNTKNKGDQLKRADLPELEHDGYIFEGWYYQGDLVRAGNFRVYADLTLTAKWTKAATQPEPEPEEENDPENTEIPVDPDAGKIKYTVTYKTRFGSEPDPITVVENTVLTAAELPILESEELTFGEWNDGKIKVEPGKYTVTEDVTLTAKWHRNDKEQTEYIGIKSPDEAKVVGDIVFSDGSAIPYTENLYLDDYEQDAAVAVIFYVGSDLNYGNDTTTTRTLGVGLTQGYCSWCSNKANAYRRVLSTITKDKNGRYSLEKMKAELFSEDDTSDEGKYPVFQFAMKYKDIATNVNGSIYESGWYIPSIEELKQIWNNKQYVYSAMNSAEDSSGYTLFSTKCWSSTPSSTENTKENAKYYYQSDYLDDKMHKNLVVVIRDFSSVPERETYSVTYETDYGNEEITIPETILIDKDSSLTASQLPILSEPGYVFGGWFDGEKIANPKNYKVTKDITLTAQWYAIPSEYIGTKSPEEAKEVGDIVFTDGSSLPYSENMTLTDYQKNAVVAIIYYVGSDLNNADDTTTIRTLGVGIYQNSDIFLEWCSAFSNVSLNSANFRCSSILCRYDSVNHVLTGDKNGSDNLKQIGNDLSYWKDHYMEGGNDTSNEAKYPAFYWAIKYKNTDRKLIDTEYESGWFLPSIFELIKMNSAMNFINAISRLCNGNELRTDSYYLSASQATSGAIWRYDFNSHTYYDSSITYQCVCAIREF